MVNPNNTDVMSWLKSEKQRNPKFKKACDKALKKLEKRKKFIDENFPWFIERRNETSDLLYQFRELINEKINKLSKKEQKEIAISLDLKRKQFLKIIKYDLTESLSFDHVCIILNYLDISNKLLKEFLKSNSPKLTDC